MIYGYILAFVAVFGFGFWAGDKFESANTARLQMAIERGNIQAEELQRVAEAKVAESTAKAAALNQTIETIHAQNLSTVNALIDRVRSASRQNCANALPSGTSPAITENKTADIDRLAKFTRLAGESAAYAESCWQFVTNNCGVVQ